MRNKILTMFLSGVIVMSLVACSSGGVESLTETEVKESASSEHSEMESDAPVKQTQEQTQTPTLEPSSKYYFENNVLVTEDVRIEIVDCEIIQIGEPGNEYGEKPVIAFTYDTTNLTGNEAVNPISAWIAFFTAVQDNDPNYVNVLDVGMAPYDEYLDTQSATIKKGGTVRDATAYELDDLETPVTLIAQRIMDDEPLGEQTYNVAELVNQ